MSFTPCEYSMLIQGLGVSLFIFSLANHTAGVPTVITHRNSIINVLTFFPLDWGMLRRSRCVQMKNLNASKTSNYSRCPGLPASSLPVCPVYRCFFFVPPRHPGLPVVCRYTGVVHFFMLAEPLLLLHTPTHAAAHNTTQHAGCCGQQPTLSYTPCHVRQENYANLVTALPPQNCARYSRISTSSRVGLPILPPSRRSRLGQNWRISLKSSKP